VSVFPITTNQNGYNREVRKMASITLEFKILDEDIIQQEVVKISRELFNVMKIKCPILINGVEIQPINCGYSTQINQ
jgi:hypothetical protein